MDYFKLIWITLHYLYICVTFTIGLPLLWITFTLHFYLYIEGSTPPAVSRLLYR